MSPLLPPPPKANCSSWPARMGGQDSSHPSCIPRKTHLGTASLIFHCTVQMPSPLYSKIIVTSLTYSMWTGHVKRPGRSLLQLQDVASCGKLNAVTQPSSGRGSGGLLTPATPSSFHLRGEKRDSKQPPPPPPDLQISPPWAVRPTGSGVDLECWLGCSV